MDYKNLKITAATSGIRLIGRMDPEQDPLAMDWTGSGFECRKDWRCTCLFQGY